MIGRGSNKAQIFPFKTCFHKKSSKNKFFVFYTVGEILNNNKLLF